MLIIAFMFADEDSLNKTYVYMYVYCFKIHHK